MGYAALFLFILSAIWIFAPYTHPVIIGFFVLLFGIPALIGLKVIRIPMFYSNVKGQSNMKSFFPPITSKVRFDKPVYDPKEFEAQIAALFRFNGYRVVETPFQGDHGIDLKAYKPDEFAIVQCKRLIDSKVGEPIVRDFFGCMQHEGADIGFIFSTTGFTKLAIDWAKGKRIVLVDGDMLQKMLDEAMNSTMKQKVTV